MFKVCICLCLFSFAINALAQERKNLSINDVIAGFDKNELFYFEMLFENGKYIRGFNKCLGSRPAESNWMRRYCQKNPEFKHAFECGEDDKTMHLWFVYASPKKCEEVRGILKDKMDAYRD